MPTGGDPPPISHPYDCQVGYNLISWLVVMHYLSGDWVGSLGNGKYCDREDGNVYCHSALQRTQMFDTKQIWTHSHNDIRMNGFLIIKEGSQMGLSTS